MANPFSWDTVFANNASADQDINWAEGQAPSTVNNSSRAEMGAVKRLLNTIGGAYSSTGASNVYAVTTELINPSLTLEAGVMVAFKANHTNTGAATLNVDATGAKAIRKTDDQVLEPGDILLNAFYVVMYDPTADSGSGAWMLINPPIVGRTALGTPTVFTASGTFNTDSQTTMIIVEGVGGGGGGAGASPQAGSDARIGAGGGAGAAGWCVKLNPDASYTVTIGSGGTGGTGLSADAPNNGGDGTATSFGTLMTLNGGSGGDGFTSTGTTVIARSGAGGTASFSGADVSRAFTGAPGENGIKLNASVRTAGNGGNSWFAGGGRGEGQNTSGATTVGGNGSIGSGGGGAVGGTAAGAAGGDGGNGMITVWEFK